VLEDQNCILELFNQLCQVLPFVMPFARIYDLACFKCRKALHRWELELLLNLFLGQSNTSNSLVNEVQDMYCMPVALLLNGLLISQGLCTLTILIHVEYSFVLHNQYIFFLSREECGWDVLECLIFIRCHQT
jgi:hypothetical protein